MILFVCWYSTATVLLVWIMVPSRYFLRDGTVPSRYFLCDGTVPSQYFLQDGTVPSPNHYQKGILQIILKLF